MITSAEEIFKKNKYDQKLDTRNLVSWDAINSNRPIEFPSFNKIKSEPALKRPKII